MRGKRVIALVLTLSILAGLLPTSVLANIVGCNTAEYEETESDQYDLPEDIILYDTYPNNLTDENGDTVKNVLEVNNEGAALPEMMDTAEVEVIPNEPQALLASTNSATVAYLVNGGNIYFDISTGKITDADIFVTDVVIPSAINGVSVTSIGDWAFYDCDNLTSIVIPDSVTSIGSYAFYSCNSLTSVTIPDSVTSIGDNTFSYCYSLTSIAISDSVTSIGDNTFYSCDSLSSVTIPDSVTSIGNAAFYGCKSLSSVTIPDSVTSIGNAAFSGCNSLTSITIPDSVTSIGRRALYSCDGLTSITVQSANRYYSSDEQGVLFNRDKTTLIQYPTGNIQTTYGIPDSVTSIGEGAFYRCGSLTSIAIPDSVTSIGEGAFSSCDSLTSVTIPNGVTSIGNYTFSGCDNLTSVTIPDSVTSIGNDAFYGCYNLTDIYYGGSEADWASVTGSGKPSGSEITIHYNSSGSGENPGSDDKNDSNVFVYFLQGWDASSKTVTVAGNTTEYIVTDSTTIYGVDSIDNLKGKYAFVELKTEPTNPGVDPIITNEIVALKAVESKIGTILDVKEEKQQVSVEKDVFVPALPGCAINRYKGEKALYHICDGMIVGIDILQEKSGVLNNWDRSTQTVTIDNVEYPTNYMTDLSFLASIDQKFGQVVSFYYVNNNWNYKPIMQMIQHTYETKTGVLQQYNGFSGIAVLENGSISVDTSEMKDISELVGKQVFFLLEDGKIIHMDALSKIKSSLNVSLNPTSTNVSYQNGSFSVSEIPAELTVSHKCGYDFPNFYDKSVVYAAANLPPVKVKSVTWEGSKDLRFRDLDLSTAIFSVGESKKVTVHASFCSELFRKYVPKQAMETLTSTATVIAQPLSGGETISGNADFAVYVNNLDIPPEQGTTDEIKKLAKKARNELSKIDRVIALDRSTMKDLFGLSGKSVTRLEQEILTVVVMSSAPKSTFEGSVDEKVLDKVLKKYKTEVTIQGYTVPLEYVFETKKYGKVRVQFDCKVTSSNLSGTRFGMLIDVNYEIISSDIPIPEYRKSGKLGGGVQADVSAFQSAAWKLAEKELKNAYNKAWGNDANKVADFLFDDSIKLILEAYETSVSDQIWKLATWWTKNTETHCPVDIYIYDQSGKQVGKIENNTVIQNDSDFRLFVYGDTKYIEGLDDTYTVKYVPTGEGMMDIGITEFLGRDIPYRQIAFRQIPLQNAITYEQNLPTGSCDDIKEYNLISSNNKDFTTNDIQVVLSLVADKNTAPYQVICSLNYGMDDKEIVLQTDESGRLSSLPVPKRSGYTFSGWYTDAVNGEKITLYTVFADDTTIYAHWIENREGSGSSGGGSGRRPDDNSKEPTDLSIILPEKTEGGNIVISPKNASKGDAVTITATPDDGYVLDILTVTDEKGDRLQIVEKETDKYTFIMPEGKVTIGIRFVKQLTMDLFRDVPMDAYYYDAVKWAMKKGITSGIEDGLFGPNQPCTRAQIVTFLWRASGSPEPSNMSNFYDVSADKYYAKAVAWAVENGITYGTNKDTFSPNEACTRAQCVTLLFRVSGAAVGNGTAFSDVPTDSYYADAVAWATENGVTVGIGNGLFGSYDVCTRAQIVAFLYRMYE